jgi:hypothetical protein
MFLTLTDYVEYLREISKFDCFAKIFMAWHTFFYAKYAN